MNCLTSSFSDRRLRLDAASSGPCPQGVAGMLAALLLSAVCALPLRAQERVGVASTGSAGFVNEARTTDAVRLDSQSISLDGRLEEGVWKLAKPATNFVQREPSDGAPATERTEVRVLVSAEALYVGVRAFDSDPAGIVARLTRRDRIDQSDAVTVLIDSYHDRRTAFAFQVTPRGAIGDVAYANDEEWGDPSWDPVWDVSTSIDASGWTAEFRIPLSQLRFSAQEETWGLQVRRFIQRKNEEDYWAPRSKDSSGFASLFGSLNGMGRLHVPSHLELRPYLVASARRRPPPEAGSPLYAPASSSTANAGLDLKYGLTSDLTLDLSVNPDFGQVEADPAQVNLTAFETYYSEHRPFFVEGSGLFSQYLPVGEIFYSRRIGRPPQGWADPPDGGTVEIPDESTILSAAKITGKTSAGLGIGVLSALTTSESGTLRDPTGAVVGEARVQPWVHHFAGRVEQDFDDGRQTLGLTVTALNRFDGAAELGLRDAAYVFLADGVHKWHQNRYTARWSLGGSWIHGSQDVILAAQRSSLRYFQRPDAHYVHVDPTRTSLGGYAVTGSFEKSAGAFRFYANGSVSSPGLDISDLGYQYGGDDRSLWTGLSYRHVRPGGPFRNWRAMIDASQDWTNGGEPTQTWLRPSLFMATFKNNWSVTLNPVAIMVGQWSPTALRGGPMLRQDTWHQSFIVLQSDGRRSVQGFLQMVVGGRWGSSDQWSSTQVGATVRPSASVSVEVEASYLHQQDPEQWVGRVVIADSTRYVLGRIDDRSLDTSVRLDWTLSPRLSWQLYAQPYVAAGAYSDYLEVNSPRAADRTSRFHAYGAELTCDAAECAVDRDSDGVVDASFGRPDYDYRSLRATSVLRWEYRPGAVLYIAWQHGRGRWTSDSTFGGVRAVPDLFRLPSDNTLLLKASYWLGM